MQKQSNDKSVDVHKANPLSSNAIYSVIENKCAVKTLCVSKHLPHLRRNTINVFC